MEDKSTQINQGIGLSGLTFAVLLVLKLANIADLSWFWVTAPLWIPLGVVGAIVIVVLVIYGLAALIPGVPSYQTRARYA